MSIRTSWALHFTGLNPLQPKPAFSLDRVSLVPTADSWAVRSGPPVSAALAGSAGFQVSAPERAFLDLTFYFSFAGLAVVGNWRVVAIVLTQIQAFDRDSRAGSCDEVVGSWADMCGPLHYRTSSAKLPSAGFLQ